jgi:hypothetical protein
LLRGDALAEFAAGAAERTEVEEAFLSASREAALAEEREQRSRRTRRVAWGASLFGVVAVALAGLALYLYLQAEVQRTEAERVTFISRTSEAQAIGAQAAAQTAEAQAHQAQAVAEAQRLALAARTQAEDSPTTALLLAAEAFARVPMIDTRDTLRDALDWPVRSRLTLGGHSGAVFSAVYSPDGQHILTASEDGTAIVWGAATGERLVTLTGHGGGVRGAAFSPDGQRILTASEDGTAIVWDAVTGERLSAIDHGGSVISLDFSPDGSRIVAVGNEGAVGYVVRQHLVSDEALVAAAGCRIWRDFTNDELERFGVSQPLAFSRHAVAPIVTRRGL